MQDKLGAKIKKKFLGLGARACKYLILETMKTV